MTGNKTFFVRLERLPLARLLQSSLIFVFINAIDEENKIYSLDTDNCCKMFEKLMNSPNV